MNTDKNTDKELRKMRDEIFETIYDSGYTDVGRVTNLTKKGVDFSGPIGARYSTDDGIILWNKSARNSSFRFALSILTELQIRLDRKFDELIKSGRLV